jgi:electron-transferring-flavoprotein dehydrogenase
MKTFELREAVGADPQTYGLGVKEVWEIPEEKVCARPSVVFGLD